ncbi:MAG: AMP-binding protein, partial [Gammaproteobacteria bacterium]|nr:AMP-binding protein [Gammaproteobacteria bacterium]
MTLVREGVDLTRNKAKFDMALVAAELAGMAECGFCVHEGSKFPFNFSSFLIEELVADEKGFSAPTDYKVFMIGDEVLWVQLHFKEEGHTWVAFVDEDFQLLPDPAWSPGICWRTHGALVCTDQTMVEARRPKCLPEIFSHSKRLAGHMGIFVRLDWYADKMQGALMGEITMFPHMLQPRNFYSAWANERVKAKWQKPDGVALTNNGAQVNLLAHAEVLLNKKQSKSVSLEDFIPSGARNIWCFEDSISYHSLHDYVLSFDLVPWGVSSGNAVALLISNGVELGALLLATMNRYVALPIGASLPAGLIVSQLHESGVSVLLVIAQTDEARKAREIALHMPDLTIIELLESSSFALPSLPPQPDNAQLLDKTPSRGLHDKVLVLRTSGSTGEPKSVSYTLAKLMRSGVMLGQSLQLTRADSGLSMLPLYHVGGIACNLVAPMLAGSQMCFSVAFNPKAFFDALAGSQGVTWCYLVPSMWQMVLDYANEYRGLRSNRPWPRLRLIRSAGSDLSQHLASELASFFGDAVSVLPTYGMTEAMPIASPALPYRLEHPGSVGYPLPTVSIEIVDSEDDKMSVVANGLVGEITVKGPTILDCYDNDSGQISDFFTPRGYFRTGDLGYFADDGSGQLFINGRIKDVINRGGETIAPKEVEVLLRSDMGWHDSDIDIQLMVFAKSHKALVEVVALAIAPLSANVDLAQFYSWVRDYLPSSMRPQMLIFLPELPRSGAGKLLRARFADQLDSLIAPLDRDVLKSYELDCEDGIPKLLEEFRPSQAAFSVRDPEANKEVTLNAVLNVVRNYVGKTIQVEPDIRFEDMGINSLSAIELAERLNERFQSQLPQWVVGDYPTPQDIFSLLSLDNMGHSSSAENRLGSAETDNPNDYQDELISHFEKSGLAADLYEGLISQTAVWQGKRTRAGSLLFGLNTDGLSPAIFWCCQVFYELSQLAKHLGSDQPIYGMRSAHRFSGDLDKAQYEMEIKRLAKYYVSEILEIQPMGPYIIGGNCQSARISFYMALELQAQGHEIGLLCMQEHIVPIGYSGRVALFFGNKSMRNPFNFFEDATVYESWSSLYAGSVSVNTITGDHGKFFTDANIQSLTE